MPWPIDTQQLIQSKEMNDIHNFVIIPPFQSIIQIFLQEIINKEIRMFNNYIAKKRELKLFRKLE